MDNSGEDKTILVVGGYGAVGSAVCERLAQTVDGRVLVAGRNAHAAQRLASRLGDRTEAVQLDVSQPSTYEQLLHETSVVVNCVEGHNLPVARRCLAHSAHYVEVSATAQILGELQTLQAEAERAGATAVLSVGVAPGLTNLLTKHAQCRRGPLARADLFVLLGLGDVHGEDAIRWTLQNLGKRFSIVSSGVRREVRSFAEGRSTQMPQPLGRRTAFRFDFSDQHTLPATLGIDAVHTWLCFDSRLATRLLWLLSVSRLPSLLPLWRASEWVATLSGWLPLGSARFAVQVDAAGADGSMSRFAVTGDGEARTTGLIAAYVARHLLGSLAPPGVLHIEQLLNLDTLLADLADDLRLQEIRSYL